jgi:hypothetical protein
MTLWCARRATSGGLLPQLTSKITLQAYQLSLPSLGVPKGGGDGSIEKTQQAEKRRD